MVQRERENEIESYVVKTFCLYHVINEKMYPIYDGGQNKKKYI